MNRMVCALLPCVLFTCPAAADQTATLPGGGRVLLLDNGTYRLLDDKKVAPAGAYVEVKMSDLKVDIKEMTGRSVRVSGVGLFFGQHLMLGDSDLAYDSSPVFVDIEKLPRESRKWIMSNCAQRCNITIEGVVKGNIGVFMPGIAAVNAVYN